MYCRIAAATSGVSPLAGSPASFEVGGMFREIGGGLMVGV